MAVLLRWLGESVEMSEEIEGYEGPCLTDAKQSCPPSDNGESPAPTDPRGRPLEADN